MDFGEQRNQHGKRIRPGEDHTGKRRRLLQPEPIEMIEQPGMLALQLMRKPALEALARRQMEQYRMEWREVSGCFVCRRDRTSE